MCSIIPAMICGVGEVPYRLLSSHTRIFEQQGFRIQSLCTIDHWEAAESQTK